MFVFYGGNACEVSRGFIAPSLAGAGERGSPGMWVSARPDLPPSRGGRGIPVGAAPLRANLFRLLFRSLGKVAPAEQKQTIPAYKKSEVKLQHSEITPSFSEILSPHHPDRRRILYKRRLAGGQNHLLVPDLAEQILPPRRVKLGEHIVKEIYRLLAGILR